MKPMIKNLRRQDEAGFTLIELLVVVGIIGIMVAVAIPAIGSYIKNYRIRGAAAQVAAELQTARARAIKRNATLGVVLVVVTPTTYRYVIEDDMTPPASSVRNNISVLVADANQVGPIRQLPQGIVFSTTAPTIKGIRFNHLGAACNPGSSGDCPNTVDVGVNQLVPAGADWLITVASTTTGLRRNIRVTPGGRISTE
jgi:prepilin-type N-terminal cleavage/methylation domain-containing protein